MFYNYLVFKYNAFQFNYPYTVIYQIIFNFYFEWINLILCFFGEPIAIIKKLDKKYCKCDKFFYELLKKLIMLFVFIFIFIVIVILEVIIKVINLFKKEDEKKKRLDFIQNFKNKIKKFC